GRVIRIKRVERDVIKTGRETRGREKRWLVRVVVRGWRDEKREDIEKITKHAICSLVVKCCEY
ncbi:hypothetical protein, partial [Burkholderia sp. Ac-20392]|uniref:hypothetical protein n=1 Tax=Burkholderia sp. Ac-20392 TaxID=2703905 RepID=UPI001981743E